MRAAMLSLVVSSLVGAAWPAAGQTLVGALAIDERQANRWGWALDYETAAAARAAALEECGAGCSVVLTFGRCGAYAAHQAGGSTAYGWGESYASAEGAQERALAECGSRGGTSCAVRAWGCNGPVVEEGLGLDRSARREVQLGLGAVGFDPGGADGLFGPRTRAAIRSWQGARGARATGYLDGASAEALRRAGASGAAVAQVARPEPAVATEAPPSALPAGAAPPRASAELEGLFWQSIMNSTNPAEFEAYLAQFPSGVFSGLARARLAALQSPAGVAAAAAGTGVGGAGSPAAGAGAPGASSRPGVSGATPGLAAVDVGPQPREVFRDCAECPEMVVLPGGRLALGRYEVTVGEYRAFASATGGGAGGGCATSGDGDSWRDPGFAQTDRHPVTCVSWDDAQAYVSWLSRTTGASYRLPTEAEWVRAAVGSEPGCYDDRTGSRGTCPVGSYEPNGAGLSDMVGNLWEWTEGCWGGCDRRVLRGGSWISIAGDLRPGARGGSRLAAGVRTDGAGFRVSRALD